MEICFREIERCLRATPRPNFLVLLGERYGWRPLPTRIPAGEFEALLIGNSETPLLTEWYSRDDNAIPAEYVLRARAVSHGGDADWPATERALRGALVESVRRAGISGRAREKYVDSATAQEIARGVFGRRGDHSNTVCCLRPLGDEPPAALASTFLDVTSDGPIDHDAQHRQYRLRQRMRGALATVGEFALRFDGGRETTQHLESMCRWVYQQLASVIVHDAQTGSRAAGLQEEIGAHARFAEYRSRHFAGRAAAIARLVAYISDGNAAPFVVTGESGSGKSALLAYVSRQIAMVRPQAEAVVRFIGATPDSSSARLLLRSIREQIAAAYAFDAGEMPNEPQDVRSDFLACISRATAEQPLVLCVDALDQISEGRGLESLQWLPARLPPHVRIVVTTLSGPLLEELRRLVPARNVLAVNRLPLREADELLTAWLRDARRTLQPPQRRDVLRCFQRSGLPLYLHVATQQAVHWSSSVAPKPFGSSVRAIVDELIAELGSERLHGPTLVAHSLGYLAAAREGLSEDEMLDLLSLDRDVMDDFRRSSPESPDASRLPYIVWSRLHDDLDPYLVDRSAADGDSHLGFFHREFRESVERAFLTGPARRARHDFLARYFDNQPLIVGPRSARPRRYNTRKLTELPHQRRGAGQLDELYAIMTSFEFVHAYLAARGPWALVEEYDRTLTAWTGSPAADGDRRQVLDTLRETIALAVPALTLDSAQLPGQLLGRLRSSSNPNLRDLLSSADAWREQPWLTPVRSSLTGPGPMLRTLFRTAGQEAVNAVDVSADGQRAVFAAGQTLYVWDLARQREIYRLRGHEDHIWHVAITDDGSRAVSAGNDRWIRRWDLDRGVQLTPVGTHKDRIGALAMSRDGRTIVTASDEGELRLWAMQPRQRMHVLDTDRPQVSALAIAPDARWAVAGTDRGTLEVWDLSLRRLHRRIPRAHRQGINGVAFLPDGRSVVSGAQWGHSLSVWTVPDAQRVRVRRGLAYGVTDIDVAPDGRLVVGAGIDELIHVWDMKTGRLQKPLKGHRDVVNGVRLLPDSRHLLSASSDGSAKLWDLDRTQTTASNWDHRDTVRALAVTADGRRAVSASFDKTLKVWDLSSGALQHALTGHGHRVTCVVSTGDGRQAVSASFDKTLRIWDLQSGRAVGDPLTGHEDVIYSLAATPDDRFAISGSWDKTLRMWNIATGAHERTFVGHTDQVNDVVVTDDGRFAFSASQDGTVRRWDLRRPTRPRIVLEMSTAVQKVSIANGNLIVVPDWQGRAVTVLDVHSGRRLCELGEHEGQISAVEASADGCRALTASGSKLRLWDLRTGRRMGILEGHHSYIHDTKFTPDGRAALSLDSSGAVIYWNLDTRTIKARFDLDGSARYCAVVPDGRRFVVTEDSGPESRVHILKLTAPGDP